MLWLWHVKTEKDIQWYSEKARKTIQTNALQLIECTLDQFKAVIQSIFGRNHIEKLCLRLNVSCYCKWVEFSCITVISMCRCVSTAKDKMLEMNFKIQYVRNGAVVKTKELNKNETNKNDDIVCVYLCWAKRIERAYTVNVIAQNWNLLLLCPKQY